MGDIMALQYQGFMDESISDDEFILAGYIATAETWAKFSEDWEQLLPLGTRTKDGGHHFKMSEMAQGRMDRVVQFYQVIDKYDLIPISFRMNLEEYSNAHERMAVVAKQMQWEVKWGLWGNLYYLVFRAFINTFHKRRENFAAKFRPPSQ